MSKYPANYLNIEQHSAAWYDARLGHVTASRVAEVISSKKNGEPRKAREDYKMELLIETLTGRPAEHYVSPAMDWGIETEKLAREEYKMAKGVEIDRIGYVLHPRIKRSGASPDGLIGEHTLVEFKCPTTQTHMLYVIHDVVPDEYMPQMMWQMACTGRAYCDFVSYDPRVPDDFSLFIKRVARDDSYIAQMERKVEEFIIELNDMCQRLMDLRNGSSGLEHDLRRSLQPGPGPEPAEIPV